MPIARGSSFPTSTICPGRSPTRPSTSSTRAEGRSGGSPISARGRARSQGSCVPAGSSTSTKGIRCCGPSTTSSRPASFGLEYDYWGGETITFPVEGSYADPTADVDAEVEHGWNHSLGEIVTALADNGLVIELLDEKRVLDWPAPFLSDRGDGTYVWPEGTRGSLPLMYSLRARKP